MNGTRKARVVPFKLQYISPERVAIWLTKGEELTLVPSPLEPFLSSCVEFRTLADHAKSHWSALNSRGKISLIKASLELLGEPLFRFEKHRLMGILNRVLEIFDRKGYFIDKKDWATGIFPRFPEGLITTLGLMTCDRVSNLRRALESYIKNSRTRKKVEFAVFDDSQNRHALDILKELKGKYEVPILYSGKEEKDRYKQAVNREGIPEHIMDFCLFGLDGARPTAGANRNAFLLHTIGELAFSADDDTVCRVSKSPLYQDGIRLGSGENQRRFWQFSNLEDALESVPVENMDLLSLHEHVLATNVQGLLKNQHENNPRAEFDMASLDRKMMEMIGSGAARTLVSLNGLVGDVASSDPSFLLYLPDPFREKLLESERTFLSAFESRHFVEAVPRLTISRPFPMMTTFFGLNHREVVPPFFPLFSNEDTLFGTLIGMCMNEVCFASLPWIAAHLPEGRSGYARDWRDYQNLPMAQEIQQASLKGSLYGGIDFPETLGQVQPYDLITSEAAVVMAAEKKLPTEENLRILGLHLKDLGSSPSREFESSLRGLNVAMVSGQLEGFQGLYDQHPKSPSYWKKTIRLKIDKCRDILRNPDPVISGAILKRWGAQGWLEAYQRMIFRYGELLVAWPDVISVAGDLKRKGIRPAVEI